jgi:hypothetical protein
MSQSNAADCAAHNAEMDRNYFEFKRHLPDLMRSDKGRFVLLRHASVIEIFDDRRAAYDAAIKRYPDHFFSIQEVTDEPLDLGAISYVRFGKS